MKADDISWRTSAKARPGIRGPAWPALRERAQEMVQELLSGLVLVPRKEGCMTMAQAKVVPGRGAFRRHNRGGWLESSRSLIAQGW